MFGTVACLKLCGLLSLHVLLTDGLAIQNVNSVERVRGEYLIKINTRNWDLEDFDNSTLKDEKLNAILSKIVNTVKDLKVIRKYVFRKTVILSVTSTFEASVANLFPLPEIENIEANVQVKSASICVKQTSAIWGLSRISNRKRQNFRNVYEYMKDDGTGTYAYVFDTGIYTDHVEFSGRAFHGYTAYNIIEEDGDHNGHGTHCTGTIISDTYGVAKGASAIEIKVLGKEGTGNIDGIIDGMLWVFNHFSGQNSTFKAVASVSLGATRSKSLEFATQELIDAGLPVVVAAGNSNNDAVMFSPAAVGDAITVGASDADDRLSLYSNWGTKVDIIAPGTDILSTSIGSPSSTRLMSGTSMATPHVSGAILRYMSQVQERPSPKQVKEWLIASASHGRVNVRGTPTPNNLLFAPCDMTQINNDPGISNIIHSNWFLVLFNMILAYSVGLLH